MSGQKPAMRAPAHGLPVALLASLALVALLGAAGGSTAIENAGLDLKHRWIALTAPGAPPSAYAVPASGGTSVSRIGANVFLEQEVEPEKRQRSLELLKAAGVGLIRQELPWEQIEPVAKGQYVDPSFGGSTWAKFDDIVDRANSLSMDVLLRLDTSPRWALPPGAPDGLSPPVNDQDYWDFVEAVATRYRGKVRAYQIWNEPNLAIEWGHHPPDPEAYARLLAGAAERIRRADPGATVVMAAMAPTLTQSADALDDLIFLQRLYDAGVRDSFDVLAVQAYGLRGGPDDPRVDATDVTFSRPELVRELMVRNGDAAHPIWATEVGWDVNPPDFPIQRFGRVTPALQARYTARALQRARAQWPWMDLLCLWYWKRADDSERNQDWYWFRLSDPNFTLQPVYYAVGDYDGWGAAGD